MNDGNTAIPVSPVTEIDMEQARTIFQRMADAVTQASQLQGLVSDLKFQVEGFKNDVEAMRQSNRYLNEDLSKARQEIDELKAIRDRMVQERDSARQELEQVRNANQGDAQAIRVLESSVDSLKRERDDAQFRNMELTDELAKFGNRLQAIQDLVCPKTSDYPSANPDHDLDSYDYTR